MRINQKTVTVNKNQRKERVFPAAPFTGQWNHVLSGVVCVLGFGLIFTSMMYFTLQEYGGEDRPKPKKPLNDSRVDVYTYDMKNCETGTVGTCSISCKGSDQFKNLSETLDDIFKTSISTQTCQDKMTISLLDFRFKNDAITENWIGNLSFSIQYLKIKGPVKSISSHAFNEKAFKQLKKLEFHGFKNFHMQNAIFEGLTKLEFLTIFDSELITIDQDVFQPFSNAIENLQIEDSVVDLRQITGNRGLKNVKIAQILNVTPMKNITSNFFSGLEMLSSFYIYGNGIEVIDSGAFASSNNLQLLHINVNNLKTLSQNVFKSNVAPKMLFVANNPWNCSCEMKWLQDHLIKNINKSDNPNCYFPEKYRGSPIIHVDLCPTEELTTPISNSSTTEMKTSVSVETSTFSKSTTGLTGSTNFTTTTEAISIPVTNLTSPTTHTTGSFVQINCKIPQLNLEDRRNNRRLLSVINNLTLPPQSMNFTIAGSNNGEVTIRIKSELKQTDILIWFIGKLDFFGILESSNTIGCLMDLRNVVVIDNLIAGETYTFCVLKNGDGKVSPLDCQAHVISVPWRKQSWVSNENRAIIIGCISAALFTCLCMGALMVYIIIRRNPSLLRGSKRVVMVKHRAADAIVMPPKFKDNITNPKRLDERRPPRTVLPVKRNNFRRSVSETSIMSSRSAAASYVSAVEPTAVQLLNWRLERLRGNTEVVGLKKTRDFLLPPTANSTPPIPPKRPSKISDFILECDNLSGISK